MKYTNPRQLLKVNETDLYDMMLRTSELLRQAAEGGIGELFELCEPPADGSPPEVTDQAREGLHKMLTYAFTCGVAFAVDQQVKNAVKTIEGLSKN